MLHSKYKPSTQQIDITEVLLVSNYYVLESMIGGACSSDGKGRGVYRVFVGKPEGKRTLRRSRRR
jgi:hypothetical protein